MTAKQETLQDIEHAFDQPIEDLELDLETMEDGHAYAYGGGSIVALILIVLLLIWIF
jgi:hypothetical protein